MPSEQRKFSAEEEEKLATLIADGESIDKICTAVTPPISKHIAFHIRNGAAHKRIRELADQISRSYTEQLLAVASRDALGLYVSLRKLARNEAGNVPADVQRAAIVDGLNLAMARSPVQQNEQGGSFSPTDLATFVKALMTEESPDAAQIDPPNDAAAAGAPVDQAGPPAGGEPAAH